MKEFLSQHQIPFEDRNIREDDAYLEELRQLGHRSIPVTLIGEHQVVGFDTEALTRYLKEAGYLDS